MADAKKCRCKIVIKKKPVVDESDKEDCDEPKACKCIVPSITTLKDDVDEQERSLEEEYISNAFANFRRVAHSMIPDCKSYQDARYCLELVNEIEDDFERCADLQKRGVILENMRKLLKEIKWICEMGRPMGKNFNPNDFINPYTTTYQQHYQHPGQAASVQQPQMTPPPPPPPMPQVRPTQNLFYQPQGAHVYGVNQPIHNRCQYHGGCYQNYQPYNNGSYLVYTAVAYQPSSNVNATNTNANPIVNPMGHPMTNPITNPITQTLPPPLPTCQPMIRPEWSYAGAGY